MKKFFITLILILWAGSHHSFADDTAQAYYTQAFSLYNQILDWQKAKNWEGVYDQAPQMRKEIAENLDKAEKLAQGDPLLLTDIKYLRWQNAKENKEENSGELFSDLVASADSLDASAASLDKIRAMADELFSLRDKNLSRRLYEIYVSKLTASDLSKEELKARAQDFLGQGNSYLAKSLFDAYLSRLEGNKEEQTREMVAIADRFAHSGWQEGLDPVFAESMYKKAYERGGIAVFNKASEYRRAFNLERLKEFQAAYDEYKNLLTAYADYSPKQEIYFRLGVLAAYAFRDIAAATDYFLKIKEGYPKDILAVSSLYQLGLLNQWKQENDKAKEFYQLLLTIAEAQGLDPETNEIILLTKDRLEEIAEKKEIKYGLRLFLEGTLLPITVDLTGRFSKMNPKEAVRYVVTTSNPQTGCMAPAYAYEWSGEVGGIANIPNAPELTTEYAQAGIKVIHVAVVGNQGLEGVGFEMVEVQGSK